MDEEQRQQLDPIERFSQSIDTMEQHLRAELRHLQVLEDLHHLVKRMRTLLDDPPDTADSK
jgi:hypothetical protein